MIRLAFAIAFLAVFGTMFYLMSVVLFSKIIGSYKDNAKKNNLNSDKEDSENKKNV